MTYKKLNNIVGWAVFAIAALVYILTMEPHGSLWDCGEFASSAYKMGIPHPPGAPLFVIIGRMFTLLGVGIGIGAGGGVALMSALSSAFTILFLFWTITHFAKKIVLKSNANNALTGSQLFDIMAAGVVGALAYTFSDSFWYSAVESEVYAMSSLCTAVVFWAALKWEDHPENTLEASVDGRNRADKWMILIFFIMGMSIGVHLLNILTIPPIILIYYFKRYKPTNKGIITALFISVLILGFVQKAVGQWSISLAFPFERLFVNSFGLPVVSGAIFFFVLLGFGLFYVLRFANKNQYGLLRLSVWCLCFLLIGMSTYLTTMIRAKANPGIDMYNVDNPYALKGYLGREQYGDFPLLYGQTYEADVARDENGNPMSVKGADKYVLTTNEDGKQEYQKTGQAVDYEYNSNDKMLFPRIWYSQEANRKDFYKQWLNPKFEVYNRADYTVDEVFDEERKAQESVYQKNAIAKQEQYKVRDHLTQAQNIKWLVSYQINWMYLRYFMWNFAGKQNDIQGFSSQRDGNWLSGISYIDNLRLGNQSNMPQAMQQNKANNKLYFLPLILGLLGMVFHFNKHRNDWLVSMLLFLMTGLAIVVYLNQYGLQPRERDYAFVGSFYAFAVWIGLGVLQIRSWLAKISKGIVSSVIAATLCIIAVPVLMANQEWNDHDRSQKTTARDLAINYLESCPQNAILFTIGDNDTYPLWYAQEVEGIRTDIRVVNTSLLGIDWYLDQLLYKVNKSAPFKMVWNAKDYEGPKMEVAYPSPSIDNNRIFSLPELIKESVKQTKADENGTESYFVGRNYYIDVDVQKASTICNPAATDTLLPKIAGNISGGKNYLTKGDMGILNIVAANINDRPICFSDDNGAELGALGLQRYLRRQGMVYQIIPSTNFNKSETKLTTPTILTKFAFAGAAKQGVYYDEENRRHLESIREACLKNADALLAEGNTEKAKEVIQLVHKQLPNYSLPYGSPSRYDANNTTSTAMADVAMRAGLTTIGKEIFEALQKDYTQQLQYYYSLSNPSAKITTDNVAAYTKDLTELQRYDFGGIKTDDDYNKKLALDKKIQTGKLTGFTFNDAIFMAKNYVNMQSLYSKYFK